jgi:two-component system LytT family sensor kinase
MGALHGIVTTGNYFAFDLIGYTTGLLVTVLLLVLTLRAVKLPGTPLANIGFAACALLWTAGGLANALLLASGAAPGGRPALLALAVQYSGGAVFPILILAIWRPFAKHAWQQTTVVILQIAACLSAAAIVSLLWAAPLLSAPPVSAGELRHATTFHAALLLIFGGAAALRRDSTPRAVYLPSLAIVSAICGALVAIAIARHTPPNSVGGLFAVVGSHLVLLVVICTFLLFARFRYADVFIRHGVRILLAGAWASVLAVITGSMITGSMHLVGLAHASLSPWTVHTLFLILVSNGFLLSFAFVDERISRLLSRWLFRSADYRAELRRLGDCLRHLQAESEIAAALEESARRPLELAGARLVARDGLPAARWPAELLEGEIVELDHADPLCKLLPLAHAEMLVPIVSDGRVNHVLLVAPGSGRPGLVSHDLNYLRAAAAQCGSRLDALRRDREAIERQSRETLLLQQVTEAELRALRAQINPHFLFNSLNTIADLIVRDPPRAEAMTLRLAGVFRHVLAHSSRPLTSVREEIEFLRTYLYIEEARFGDRLHVEIDMAPEVAGESIPSLILQPLVENALKHGLGPKPGPGHLWISAAADGDRLRLRVEDDGMGPNPRTTGTESQGLGLSNIAERLKTLYDDRASVVLAPREGGGSCATVLLPRTSAMKAI